MIWGYPHFRKPPHRSNMIKYRVNQAGSGFSRFKSTMSASMHWAQDIFQTLESSSGRSPLAAACHGLELPPTLWPGTSHSSAEALHKGENLTTNGGTGTATFARCKWLRAPLAEAEPGMHDPIDVLCTGSPAMSSEHQNLIYVVSQTSRVHQICKLPIFTETSGTKELGPLGMFQVSDLADQWSSNSMDVGQNLRFCWALNFDPFPTYPPDFRQTWAGKSPN